MPDESANPVQEAWAAVEEAADEALDGDARGVPVAARALALACIEATWQAAYSEYGYVSEEEFAVALGPLRARINALHQDGREPPQEEGT